MSNTIRVEGDSIHGDKIAGDKVSGIKVAVGDISGDHITVNVNVTESKNNPNPITQPINKISPEHVPIFYSNVGVIGKPERLFGRDGLVAQVHQALDADKNVLLCGMGGSGKTAVAATVADDRLTAGKGSVIWLQPGDEDANSIFEAIMNSELGRAGSTPSSGQENGRLFAVREHLIKSQAKLLVLDDVWRADAVRQMQELLRGTQIPLLVTSRQQIPTGNMLETNDLSLEDALSVLAHYANDEGVKTAVKSTDLCKLLGNHAYALEIAGRTLRKPSQSPAKLYRNMKKAAATHEAVVQLGYGENGRTSVKLLLDESFAELDTKTQEAFTAMGAFFAPGLSTHLLAFYLNWSLEEAEGALETLLSHSLVKWRAGIDLPPQGKDVEIDYYYMHALTFSYARARFKANGGDYLTTVKRVAAYVANHTHNFDLLYCDQNDIIESGRYAQTEAPELLLQITSCLSIGGYPKPTAPSYLDVRGHTQALLDLLNQAIDILKVEYPVTQRDLHHYLTSKLGNIYLDRQDFDEALEAYSIALETAPSDYRYVVASCIKSRALFEQGNQQRSSNLLKDTYVFANERNDNMACSFVLQYLSWQAGMREDYQAASQYARESVQIYRDENMDRELGYVLVNLGSAEFYLKNFTKALQAHKEAVQIAEKADDLHLLADALYAHSKSLHATGHTSKVEKHLVKALQLCRQIGDQSQEKKLIRYAQNNGYDNVIT